MSHEAKIADLHARIAKTLGDADCWRGAGSQEKYLEAYSQVEALEIELDQVRRLAGKFPPDTGAPPPAAETREGLMAEFSISLVGGQYQYAQYRYDRLDDAVAYAKKQRVAPSACDAGDVLPAPRAVEAPDELQLRRIGQAGITFRDGRYHFGPYSYDRLEDAMRYARLQGVAAAH